MGYILCIFRIICIIKNFIKLLGMYVYLIFIDVYSYV